MPGHPAALISLTPGRRGRIALLCLPYAGGGSSAFHDWPRWLPDGAEVYTVRLPGRESRLLEQPVRDLTTLVTILRDEVARLATGPYVLFGHSMGALVGYELVRALRAAGRPEPLALVASGHSAPHRTRCRRPLHLLPDAELIEELRGYGATPAPLLAEPALMELFLPTLRADFAVVETYTHRPGAALSCPIHVFGGDQDIDVTLEARHAWAELTTRPCVQYTFPGGHFFIDEARAQVCAALTSILGSDTGQLAG